MIKYSVAPNGLELKCGCYGGRGNNSDTVYLCPLHGAAPALLAALEELIVAADPATNMSDIVLLDALSRARAIAAQAKGDG